MPLIKVQRFSLRLDGFASINAPYAGGEMVTVPLVFAGDRLELNYATGAVGKFAWKSRDVIGRPLPGFALEDSAVLVGDRIAEKRAGNPERRSAAWPARRFGSASKCVTRIFTRSASIPPPTRPAMHRLEWGSPGRLARRLAVAGLLGAAVRAEVLFDHHTFGDFSTGTLSQDSGANLYVSRDGRIQYRQSCGTLNGDGYP